MTNRRQKIQIGDSVERIERVVRQRVALMPLGLETGYVEHRCDSIPVWRPINPVALGLDSSWLDGVWRNIYNWTLPAAASKAQPFAGFIEYQIADKTVALPGANVTISQALLRFLKQHLR